MQSPSTLPPIMKIRAIILVITVVLTGCSNINRNDIVETKTTISEKIPQTNNTPLLENKINYTDKNGKKQGRWITMYKHDTIVIKTYKNDTLDGYYCKKDGTPYWGNYKEGMLDGMWYMCYGSYYQMMYYEHGNYKWSGFYSIDKDCIITEKHFDISTDSLFIRVPFINGNICYEGAFIKHGKKYNEIRKDNPTWTIALPVGIHKVYFENGKIKGIVDYTNKKIKAYDSDGNVLYDTNFGDYATHKQTISGYFE
jgi:hypothetical protein